MHTVTDQVKFRSERLNASYKSLQSEDEDSTFTTAILFDLENRKMPGVVEPKRGP